MSHAVSPPRPVDVAGIERELAKMWHDPDDDPTTPSSITRACMSNLVIWSATMEEAQLIPDEISVIVQQHPARVIHLIGEGAAADAPVAANAATMPVAPNISAFCALAGGEGKSTRSEQITLVASRNAKERLPSVVRSLLIGDLPTALWWADNEPPPMGGEVFQELAAMSNVIIYESQAWLDPIRQVTTAADWAGSELTKQLIADLEWRRLKTWRRLISQTLDPAVAPGALESITAVRLDHGPHALPKAWMLAGWLACKLGWRPEGGKVAPGVEVTWRFRSSTGPVNITIHRLAEGSPKVHSGSISHRAGGVPTTVHFDRLGPGRLGVRGADADAPPRVQVMPSDSRAVLVGKQLPDLGRDNLFRETLQVSRTMAEALRH